MPASYFMPAMPEGLEGLIDLALDIRWSWNHAADKLWRAIAPDLWAKTGNPWLILQTVSGRHLQSLATDPDFKKLVDTSISEYREATQAGTWFQETYSGAPFGIAYFCMEFGLSEALPIYSGGLGILAGDYLKTASDLGVPVIGVGLLYQQGYFRQEIDSHGDQTESFPYNDPSQLPIMPVRNPNGAWLRVKVDFPGRAVLLRCWEVKIGRVKLYLLDSNDPVNMPVDRGITSELYGGDSKLRLEQEIILGIGGWRMLHSLDIHPEICHLNEGHAALAVIERARMFMKENKQPFDVALAATRPGNVFTTHTPVEAGFDLFARELISQYLDDYSNELGIGIEGLMDLGRCNPFNQSEPLNMAYLATRGSLTINAVSQLHGEVSRRIFQLLYNRWPQREVPMTHVTNGVHMPSWDSSAADESWTNACGKGRWLSTLETVIEDFKKVSDETLWDLRMSQTSQFLPYVKSRLASQMETNRAPRLLATQCGSLLDPNILTVGFARRFTEYKRPNLLLHNPDRLQNIINHQQCPVQLIIAGKAHPLDGAGKALVQEWWEFAMRPEVRGRVVFLADYDIGLASQMIQGVDLWLNTPRRPWEASGTSGMKVLVNGGLNISELDGWWAEAYRSDVGWAIGDGQEHDSDIDWDATEADQLYSLIENSVVPEFYGRDNRGIPVKWVERMRASMAELTPQYSANRMLREYIDNIYVAAARGYSRRTGDHAREAVDLCRWRDALTASWHKLRFGNLDILKQDDSYMATVTVFLYDVDSNSVQVQLYAEPENGGESEKHVMEIVGKSPGTVAGYLYRVSIPARRPIEHYTPRVVPRFDGASIPLEFSGILWYEK